MEEKRRIDDDINFFSLSDWQMAVRSAEMRKVVGGAEVSFEHGEFKTSVRHLSGYDGKELDL